MAGVQAQLLEFSSFYDQPLLLLASYPYTIKRLKNYFPFYSITATSQRFLEHYYKGSERACNSAYIYSQYVP